MSKCQPWLWAKMSIGYRDTTPSANLSHDKYWYITVSMYSNFQLVDTLILLQCCQRLYYSLAFQQHGQEFARPVKHDTPTECITDFTEKLWYEAFNFSQAPWEKREHTSLITCRPVAVAARHVHLIYQVKRVLNQPVMSVTDTALWTNNKLVLSAENEKIIRCPTFTHISDATHLRWRCIRHVCKTRNRS